MISIASDYLAPLNLQRDTIATSGAILVASFVVLAGIRDVYRKRTSNVPPGPAPLLFIGNLLQIPTTFLHRKFDKLSKQYGPVFTVWMMGLPFVVFNDATVAAEVLDRMSGPTSDRPILIKSREFYFHDRLLVMQDHTHNWRNERKAMHSSLNVRACMRFSSMQANDAAYLTLGLLQHPEPPFHQHLHRYAASVIVRLLYGGDPLPIAGPDPSAHIHELTMTAVKALVPTNSIVDLLPFLAPIIRRVKYLQRAAIAWNTEAMKEATWLYDTAESTDQWGNPTMTADVKSNTDKYDLPPKQEQMMLLQLYMAGQETTHTALRVFGLLMLHNPHVAKEAQKQLDAVCGQRPPNFEDKDNLPYITAIVKETLRWLPPLPTGVPHRASEDFHYREYTIPKGAVLLDNTWTQTRDPSLYLDPETYNPSRFIDENGALLPGTQDTHFDLMAFGRGRRVCPGRDFAFNSLFIGIAYMLWAFNFDWPVDAKGKPVIARLDAINPEGVGSTPLPYGIILTSRKENLEERLVAAMKE